MAIEYEKYVVVTGGAGFIGSNFLDLVTEKYPQYFFLCIDKIGYASGYDTKNLKEVMGRENFELAKIDIAKDYEYLKEILVERRAERPYTCVINFAAESCVDRSFENSRFFTMNNVIGTQNVLECFHQLQENGVEGLEFVHISTDEVYGDQMEGVSVDEDATLNPTNPYSASKAAIDLIIKSYKYCYGLEVSILRSNNVYGPRQFPEKLVSRTLSCLLEDSRVPIHGDGRYKRKYLHVYDLCDAIDFIWHCESAKGKTYNVGSDDEIDNLSLVKLICQLFYDNENVDVSKHIEFVKDRRYNDTRYSTNFEKMTKLGWRPRIKFYDGIKMLVEYTKRNGSIF